MLEDNEGVILRVLTLLPPMGITSIKKLKKIPAYITELDLETSERFIALIGREGQFKETENPVYAIEAFILSLDMGIYPPMWVLNFMKDIFKRYHDSLGKEKLDGLFGFRGTGKCLAFKKVLKQDRDQMLMADVFKLNVMGYSVQDASAMVAIKLEAGGWDKTGLEIGPLSADAIEQIYSKKWKKLFDYNGTWAKEWLKDKNNRTKFLNTFPEDCLQVYRPIKAKKT